MTSLDSMVNRHDGTVTVYPADADDWQVCVEWITTDLVVNLEDAR